MKVLLFILVGHKVFHDFRVSLHFVAIDHIIGLVFLLEPLFIAAGLLLLFEGLLRSHIALLDPILQWLQSLIPVHRVHPLLLEFDEILANTVLHFLMLLKDVVVGLFQEPVWIEQVLLLLKNSVFI
mmetsp:Transcript_33663/g.32690  ORF Transcript_33663/g.32690 Transcript_33663/m.32690 type:complete len:126 (+) Transcript_33663:711-1088(+)